ncbi:complement C4-B-like [Rhinophrynus dorsalis]
MGPPTLLHCLLWVAIFFVSEAQVPNFLIVAPRILHVGVDEAVWVQLEWPPGSKSSNAEVKVELYLRNQNNMLDCSAQQSLTLNKANQYIASQKIKITHQRAATCKLSEKRRDRYVQLVAKSEAFGSSKLQIVSIPVTYRRGYIFIQTDKSIYTPKESVNIRAFTLDHMMRPTEESVTLSVFNAQALQVRKVTKVAADSLMKDNLQIPDISTPGVWKISAYFTNAPESNFTSEFEVRKYVLPNFEVKIIPLVPYFLISDKEFTFRVESRYVYGESVVGVAYVRVGITDQNGMRNMLRGLEQQEKLDKGDVIIKISMADILSKINQPVENLLGSSLYIAASVIETSSGALEEIEITSVKFATSPYKLDLSKTKRYFIPGTPALIVVEVSYTDGSPATGIPVHLSNPEVKLTTDRNGVATYSVNTGARDKILDIKVTAGEAGVSEVERIQLNTYNSKTSSYLYMDMPGQVLRPGETIKLTLMAMASSLNVDSKIYYMVLNKGQILSMESIKYTPSISLSIPITSSMIPSFRVIAYYHLGSEIIANSIWVDVTDICEGKLELRAQVEGYVQPGEHFQLTVETEGKASVSLSAVDTAVYILNSKNKLTPGKVYKAMNAYDLGCSPGGGKDYQSVFTDAGLAFVSSAGYSKLNELGCKTHQRKKRTAEFQVKAQQKVHTYPPNVQRCCRDGMTLLPRRMVRSCTQRASRIESVPCRDVFRSCCDYAEKLRSEISINKRKQTGLGRTQDVDDDEDDFADEEHVQFRTSFPESFLWRTIPVNGLRREVVHVPHSITTWEIQGVGISKEKGFCVAEPIKVKVFKPFHIHMRVPASVKRFEQIELKPVLYNYHEIELKVKVYLEQADGLCCPVGGDGGPQERLVTVPGHSSYAVPFTVVPIGKSNTEVTVMALGQLQVSDGVKKTLHIMREGVSVLDEKTYIVDPKDRARQSIDIDEELPSNLIPDGDFHSSIRVTMDSAMNTINNSLSADGVSKLIRVPYGCAEQTMISTSPVVYAVRYLDHTEKWTMLPPDRKDQGLENMRQGYSRILTYRKKDASYGAWLERTSSTWLTAFVVKVLSLCRLYIEVDVNEIRSSAQYLTSMQTSTGAFQELLTVIHRDMQGGVRGTNAEVSLTAYVTVALHHSLDSLAEDDTEVKSSISKAIDYLRKKVDSLSDPYALAVTTYALTLTSRDSVLKDKAYHKLLSHAQGDPNKKELYFGTKGTALAVETTAYALLVSLLREDMDNAEKMYIWLSEQQNYGGGFRSTQDTVMALEALSEYWIRTYKPNQFDLEIEVNSLERQQKQRFILRNEDNLQEELRSMGTKFNIKVSGKGKGMLTVLKMYNIMQIDNSSCTQLGLEVKLTEEVEKIDNLDDDDYDYQEDEVSDEPRSPIAWHDLRKRARREISQPKTKDVRVSYEVCLWLQPRARVSGMAIVDITMLSGFEPVAQDLDKLKDSSERYISHYEIHPGRLLIYFDKVPDPRDCVYFDAVQKVKISPLQPASAVLYDFYEPETKCTVSYGAPSKPNFISTLCSGDVCQCAEGPCPKKRDSLAKSKEIEDRQSFACYSPRVQFGYKVTVENIKEQDAFLVYEARIAEVLQKSADEDIKAGDTRSFYQRLSCKMKLDKGTEYLIMGSDGETKDKLGQLRYLLDNKSWVEQLPSSQKCKATRFRNACVDIQKFMENYRDNGCSV